MRYGWWPWIRFFLGEVILVFLVLAVMLEVERRWFHGADAATLNALHFARSLGLGLLVAAYALFFVIERIRQVQQAEAKVHSMLESTDEGIWGLDADGRVTFTNRAAATMCGYNHEELVGVSIHDLIHYKHPDGSAYPYADCPVAESIRTGSPARLDTEVYWRADGSSFPVEYSTYPIFDGSTIYGAVVAFHDITDRKALEKARLIEEYNRMRTTFINSAAHQLNTPLQPMMLQARVLRKRMEQEGGDEKGRQAVEILDRNLTRLQTLTEQILLVTQLESETEPRLEPDELTSAVREALQPLRGTAEEKDVRLDESYDGRLPIRAEHTNLRIALRNLLENAVKYTPLGGHVRIATARQGDKAVVHIEDSGPGIPPETANRLFQPFVQLDTGAGRTDAGWGLNLYITKTAVERIGGDVAYAPRAGEPGSSFVVQIPLANP